MTTMTGRHLTRVVHTVPCRASPTMGAAILLSVVAMANCGGGTPVRDFSRSASAIPQWDSTPDPPEIRPGPETVDVHLDVSYPMAGFLPPASRPDEPSVLRTVAQNVASHLSRVYGGGGISLRWHAFGHRFRSLSGTPRIEQDLFDGRWSRITLSIERILEDLEAGRSEAAALVTDLIATDDVTGPLAVSNALAEWLASDAVRSGTFHVALIGAKADYRGWHPAGCPEIPDQPGCVHNERTGTNTRLGAVVQIPVYVLLLGRDVEKVEDVMESVGRGIEELRSDPEIEIKWEILTRRSNGNIDTELSCDAGDQFALFKNDSGLVSCARDDTVTLSCRFTDRIELTAATAAVNLGGETAQLPGAAEVREVAGSRLDLDIGCAELRPRSEPASVRLNQVEGRITPEWEVDWRAWSTEIDELGKTLQLEGFVRELRIVPDRYRIELRQPILEFGAP